MNIAFDAFLLPGSYTIDAAVLDTAKHEFGTLREEFTVPEPSRYLQVNLWQGTPPVEFITSKVSPDNWFLPDIHSGIAWPPPTDKPTNLAVLLNIGQTAHRPATPAGGLPLFLPVRSVLLRSISLNISKSLTVLDLSRHRVIYRQSSAPLNWSALRQALESAANEGMDLRSLSEHNQDAQFFLRSFHSAVSAIAAPCTVVILSPPLVFRRGQNLTLLPGEASPCGIFYLRYAVPSEQTVMRRLYRAMHLDTPDIDPDDFKVDEDPEPPLPPDQLAETLRQWHPKVIDIESAEQLNKVFRDIAISLR